ncbi:NAD-dependent epimerase/dehydratase family protein [Cytobacillus sp. FJAT-54145]|uniref:NAD-dependent epimerase/dehydratase family protein n=1 Tax=Cytobacillus spartinae TaxID=3299023 RepID=A0ABW6K5C0_9BACI
MKVLVTGGAGFIGKHVVAQLLQQKYKVAVIDKQKNPFKKAPISYYPMNIKENLEDIFAKEKPDYVIHLAAQIDVNQSVKNPLIDASTNIVGTINVLESCRKFGVKKIIYASSAAVYGEPKFLGINESHETNPVSFYGLSKLTGEQYVSLYSEQFGFNFSILRYANVYGHDLKRTKDNDVISIFIKQIMANKRPIIFGDGNQTRDFIYVKDVACANIAAIQEGNNSIYNIGTNHGIQLNTLVRKLNNILGTYMKPEYMHFRAGEILHSYLNNEKALKELNWQTKYSLDEGLIETIIQFNLSSTTKEVHQ